MTRAEARAAVINALQRVDHYRTETDPAPREESPLFAEDADTSFELLAADDQLQPGATGCEPLTLAHLRALVAA